ncbi:MAG TPA: hypothetical protein QGH10_04105 [Armatimonadota bacterium]|nr:hypothetical protein [Armatimonadota bacterium]
MRVVAVGVGLLDVRHGLQTVGFTCVSVGVYYHGRDAVFRAH